MRDTPRMNQALPHLPLARYRLRFTAHDELRLPDYAGSMWRGAFGHALKRALCVTREPSCPGCALYRSCAYAYVFETPPPEHSAKMRKYPAAPHPYVLLPGADEADVVLPGETLGLTLTLAGDANRQLAVIVHAFAQAARDGLGKVRARFALDSVEQESAPGREDWSAILRDGTLQPLPACAPAIPPVPERCAVQLVTHLRLMHDERLVKASRFDFGVWFPHLLRRVSMLTYFHTDTPLETDFAALTAAAKSIRTRDAKLTWSDWTRYSSRQGRSMELGGLLGEFVLEGDLSPYWPYLWLGQFVHAGKNASMGLGGYRLVP
jgi:hypothetical protein